MLVKKIPSDQITPAIYNPRKDLKPGDKEYEKLKKSIVEFGYVEPLIWNKQTGNLVGGHQRFKVLLDQGHTEVEVSVVDLPIEKEKALNIALNKIDGAWDDEKLQILLSDLSDGELDFTGFDFDELQDLLANESDSLPDLDRKDLSDRISDTFELIVTCTNEVELEELYNQLTEEGHECRILTS